MKHFCKIFIFLFLILNCSNLISQNLVPNPSFEDTIGCPQGYPDLDTKCQFWKSFRGTPDYMNNCSSVCGYYNQYGFQQPNSGYAYAGIATYQVTAPDSREHIGIQLASPLIIGTKYYVSFFVSPAWNNNLTNIATNKMGALVTTYQYSDPSGSAPLQNTSTLYTDSIIKDTLNWYKVFGSFTADSAYQYLVIGSWFDDNSIDTLHFPYLVVHQAAYYYLDDVCLSTDSIYSQTWTGIVEQQIYPGKILIYPNPIVNDFFIEATNPIKQIEIIDLFGQMVFTAEDVNDPELKLSSFNLKNGLYFIVIKTINEFYIEKIIINH